nr:MAG TPA: Fibronectin-binding repeat [Caudoviricetes sp.]
MTKNTIKAIEKRIANGENWFYIGAYFYQVNIDGTIRRREQKAGYTPTSDWELVEIGK